MKKFTVNQLALLGSIFWNDEDNLAEFIEGAKRIKQFVDLGDPYDIALILEFLGQIFKPEGALSDPKTLERYVEKVVYWLEK